MNLRRILIISFLLFAVVAFASFLIEKYIRPILPAQIDSSLALGIAAILMAASFLASLKDVFELVEKIYPQDKSAPKAYSNKNGLDAYIRLLSREVSSYWLEGVLKNNKKDLPLIEMSKTFLNNVVENPWRDSPKYSETQSGSVKTNASITSIFEGSAHSLLILGAPGSGKTTLLLQLAEYLLKKTYSNENLAIPVVFHLWFWKKEYKSMDEWLTAELHRKYNIPITVAKELISTEKLTIMLDSMDDIPLSDRETFVSSFNDYAQTHTLTGIALTCRYDDYQDLLSHLKLRKAILLMPLTRRQVDDWLAKLGEKFLWLKESMKNHREQDFLDTPLKLRLAMEIYPGNVQLLSQKDLIEAFVESMLQRKKALSTFTPDQVSIWLSKIAYMISGAPFFYPEYLENQISVAWLHNDKNTWFFSFAHVLIQYLPLLGLLLFWFAVHPLPEIMQTGFLIGLALGLLFLAHIASWFYATKLEDEVLIRDVQDLDRVRGVERLQKALHVLFKRAILRGVVVAFIVVIALLGVGIMFRLINISIILGFIIGLSFALFEGMLSALTGGYVGFSIKGHNYAEYFFVRLLLQQEGSFPLNLQRFLNFATTCGLLKRTGKAFSFYHPLVQEYFSMHGEQIEKDQLDRIIKMHR